MTKEDLIKLKEKISKLSALEQKQRDLYLRKLGTGEVYGPMTGYASVDKPWLAAYPEERVANSHVPKMSLYEYMYEHTKDKLDLPAEEYFGKKMSVREVHEHIIEVAKALKALGVKPGDSVSVCLPNTPESVYVFYGINYLGAVANTQDPRSNKELLINQVDTAKSDVAIVLDQLSPIYLNTKASKIIKVSAIESLAKPIQVLAGLKDKSMRPTKIKDDRLISYDKFIDLGKNVKSFSPYYKENSPAVIAYTGGTTGEPKGAIVTNEAFNTMIMENSLIDYNKKDGDRWLNMAPPWTYYGLSNSLNSYLCLGLSGVLLPKFGPDELGKLVKKYKPNGIVTVPAALVGLMNEKGLGDLSYLKEVVVGADKFDPAMEEKFKEFLKEHNSHANIRKGYGMTEVTAGASCTVKNYDDEGTVGVPFILGNVAVFNPDDKDEELTYGKTGEIAFYGPKNMVGYFGKNASKNGEVLKKHSDGKVWVHSGDAGTIDNRGLIRVSGRYKRMFPKNGFKIFPGAIENQILNIDDVDLCAVIPVREGTEVRKTKAYIKINPNTNLSEDEIKEKIMDVLSKNVYDYEMPDEIEAIDEMPLTGMNKIDFKALEKKALEDTKTLKKVLK